MMKKRAISLLLALLLTLSLLPGSVFAVPAEAEDAAAETRSFVDMKEEKLSGTEHIDLGSDIFGSDGMMTLEAPAVQSSAAIREEFDNRLYRALYNRREEVDVSDLEMSPEECAYRYCGLTLSHPELFFAIRNWDWDWEIHDDMTVITKLRPGYLSVYDERDRAVFFAVSHHIVDGMPAGTDAERMLYLHDYLVTHCQYHTGETVSDLYNAYNCLVESVSVCQGYAAAFLYLCQLAGLEASFVTSDSLHHAWNTAKPSDGSLPYLLDCTWDDPTGDSEYYCRHLNFLRSKASFHDKDICRHTSEDWNDEYGDPIYDDLVTDWKYELSTEAWWRDLERPVQWVGSTMGYARPEDFGHIYLRWSGEAEEHAIPIDESDGAWIVWGQPGYIYPISCVRVAALGDSFYYSTSRHIWRLEKDWSSTLVYTLTEDEQARGEIYELVNDNGNLRYCLGQAPDDTYVGSGLVTFPPKVDDIFWWSTCKAGKPIYWVAMASGGDGDLTYGFNVYKDGNYVYGSGTYISDNVFSYTPTEGGTYSIEVIVKDGAGAWDKLNSVSVTVTAPPVIENVWADRSTAAVGEAITWTASASGGSGSYGYWFVVTKDGVDVYSSGGSRNGQF